MTVTVMMMMMMRVRVRVRVRVPSPWGGSPLKAGRRVGRATHPLDPRCSVGWYPRGCRLTPVRND